jgi:aquaporin Z
MAEEGNAKYIAEFIGTFMLVFTIGCNVLSGQPIWGGISIACVLTVMIYAFAQSSGANFNPAVSVALGLTGAMKWPEVAMYSIVQTVAGICGGFCYTAFFDYESINLGPLKGHNWWQAGLAETIYTFMLCFVVLNTAASKVHGGGKDQFYGLAIGFVIVAGAYSGGSVSMGCFNPAVAFGIDVSSALHHGVKYCFVYTIFELIGAVLAAAAFMFCRADQEKCKTDEELEKAEVNTAAKLLSEFIGTYMLVLTVGLNVLSGSKAAAFSIAASLMCMIFALGTVSGAHFNPAVTVAVMCSGKRTVQELNGEIRVINDCPPQEGAMYMGAQILGGICAAFTYSAMMNGETFALKPAGYKWSQALMAEFIFTFVLAFVVLSVATVKNGLTHFFGFAIGMCVTVGGFAIGKVSGGSLNPAVSVGISTSHIVGGGNFWPCLIYMFFECLAGAVAAGVFMVTQPSEYAAEKSA